MSLESRLLRGDNPDDVRKLYPRDVERIEACLKSMEKKSAKKAPKKKTKA